MKGNEFKRFERFLEWFESQESPRFVSPVMPVSESVSSNPEIKGVIRVKSNRGVNVAMISNIHGSSFFCCEYNGFWFEVSGYRDTPLIEYYGDEHFNNTPKSEGSNAIDYLYNGAFLGHWMANRFKEKINIKVKNGFAVQVVDKREEWREKFNKLSDNCDICDFWGIPPCVVCKNCGRSL